MTLSQYVAAYVAVSLTLAVLDVLYLTLGGLKRYRKHLGTRLRMPVGWVASIPLYLVAVGGFVYLAIKPAVLAGSMSLSALNSMFLGLLLFCFLQLTNMATLKDWPRGFAVGEIAWGAFAGAVMGAVGFEAVRLF